MKMIKFISLVPIDDLEGTIWIQANSITAVSDVGGEVSVTSSGRQYYVQESPAEIFRMARAATE